MISKPAARLLDEIRAEWDKAENYIKIAEQITDEVVGPAIAELRYAGRRIVDALNGSANGMSAADVKALLDDAKFNCHRARHDALDASFSKIALDLDLIARRIGYKAVLAAYPKFSDFLGRLDNARRKVALARANREQRDEIYANLADIDLPALVEDYRAVMRQEGIMRSIAAKDKVAFWVTAVLGVVGYALAFYFWEYPRPAPEQPNVAQLRDIPQAADPAAGPLVTVHPGHRSERQQLNATHPGAPKPGS